MPQTDMPSDSTADTNDMFSRFTRPYHMSFNNVDRVGVGGSRPRPSDASTAHHEDNNQEEQDRSTRAQPTSEAPSSRRSKAIADTPFMQQHPVRPHRSQRTDTRISSPRRDPHRPSRRGAEVFDGRSTYHRHPHPDLSPIQPSRHRSHCPSPRHEAIADPPSMHQHRPSNHGLRMGGSRLHDRDAAIVELSGRHRSHHARNSWTATSYHQGPRQEESASSYAPAFVFDPRTATMYHTHNSTHPSQYNQLVSVPRNGSEGSEYSQMPQQQHRGHDVVAGRERMYPVLRHDGPSLAYGRRDGYFDPGRGDWRRGPSTDPRDQTTGGAERAWRRHLSPAARRYGWGRRL